MAETVQTVPLQSWMTDPNTRAVMRALEAAGGAGCARFVGGCVRNTLMGRPVEDIDIATTLTPDVVTASLKSAGLKAVATGIEHGTVTAVAGRKPFEVTTLRRDVETDGRRAVVTFSTDWAEDARRRDFRLNALYTDVAGTLFDPTGEGVADALAGRIIFVGEARTRILEDALRILRFFRFSAWYGKGAPDPDALAACAALKDKITGLSAERVAKELLKLLAADDPRPAMQWMWQAGVLAIALPETQDLARFERLVAIETEQLFSCDPELRLGALLPDDPLVAASCAKRLRLSNAQRDRLVAMAGTEPALTSGMSPRETRRAVYHLGADVFCDRVLLGWAGSDRTASDSQWRALLALARTWVRPSLPLSGDDVVAAGAPKGPVVGAVLREVEAWWIDSDFTPDKLAVIARLKALVQG